MWQLLNVSYLVLEGLRSQSSVEWCEVSGKTLKVTFYLLLLKDRFWSYGVNNSWFKKCVLPTGVIVMSNISH